MRRAAAALAALAAATSLAAPGVLGQSPAGPRFTDVTAAAGLDALHVNGASAVKHLPETIGSGGLFFDFDNDGWLDILLVDGGSIADPAVARRARHRLFRNRGNGTFEDRSAAAGLRHSGYGMGACAADVDGDGWTDVYITNVGANALYRNRGDGTFADVTAAAGVGLTLWSASCAFADLDRDGDLDLFVTNYVTLPDEPPFCGNARTRTRFYCHPLNFEPLPNVLYRNEGGGRFTDASAAAGIAGHLGNGLGVVIADLDDDGWPDVFVANDSMPNFLFRNRGDGRFEEIGLAAGVAVATDGQSRAGMGTDAADYDGDGRLDLVVTNLDFETHSLFRNLGDGLFAYATVESGLGFATLPFVGFGVAFLDADHDGRLDLAMANGHIMDNAPAFRAGASYAQRNLLFHNRTGRRFVEVGASAGSGFALEKVGRGLAAGDIDHDGDLDLLVTNNGQRPDLLRNDGAGGHALLLDLAAAAGARDAVGARVRVTTASGTQRRDVTAGASYLSQHDRRLHVGLGASPRADRLEIRWPSGRVETLNGVEAGRLVTIREGEGVTAAVPFVR